MSGKRSRWKSWIAVLLFALLFGPACVNTGSYHTAKPVEADTTEMGMALEVYKQTEEEGFILTEPRVNVRRGISDQTDFGFTAGSFGAGADINQLLSDSDGVAFSINPNLRLATTQVFGGDDFGGDEDVTTITAFAGLLVDIAAGDDATFTLGFKPGFVRVSEEGDGANEVFLAGSAGMRIDLDAEGQAHLFPEVNISKIMDEFAEGVLITFGLGFGF